MKSKVTFTVRRSRTRTFFAWLLAGSVVILSTGCAPIQKGSELAAQQSASEATTRSFNIFQDCPTCPQMVVVDGDSKFVQGPTSAELVALGGSGIHTIGKQKIVAVSTFAVTRAEITIGQFKEFLSSTNYRLKRGEGCTAYATEFPLVTFMPRPTLNFHDPGFEQTESSPVVCVTIEDALSYAQWLSRTTGHKYRLPTEAEWEILARATQAEAGNMSPESDADRICRYENIADDGASYSFDVDQEWSCDDGYGDRTSPARSYRVNRLGVFDVLGNASEYIGDCADDYDIPANQIRQWSPESSCKAYVIKGGSFLSGYPSALPSARFPSVGDHRVIALGFRLVREL